MKRIALVVTLMSFALAGASADVQVRLQGNYSTPFNVFPDPTFEQWTAIAMPTAESLTGWSWEVIFTRLGIGMHYGVRFDEPGTYGDEWTVDWKGDFFLSYHPLTTRATIDPFVEVGWGNSGRAVMADYDYEDWEYPDWENELDEGDAVSLALFQYVSAGVALNMGGLVVGGKVSYLPDEFVSPIPGADIEQHHLSPFEFGFFAGVSLGGH